MADISLVWIADCAPYEVDFRISEKIYTYGASDFHIHKTTQIAKHSERRALAYIKKHCDYCFKGKKEGGK